MKVARGPLTMLNLKAESLLILLLARLRRTTVYLPTRV